MISALSKGKFSIMKTNVLYYGDNLVWLRNPKYFPDESIDLIYLDPPFNSNADYNVIFNEPSGIESQAQLRAFDDTWRWDSNASGIAQKELAYRLPELSEFIGWLGKQQGRAYTSMAAYLSMMAVRLVELHRVLKATGSIYLHCDSTASHYLKIVMDLIFGADNFKNEIIWKRRYGTFSTVHESNKFGASTDNILFYVKGKDAVFHPQYSFEDEKYRKYVERTFKYIDENGRRYRIADLANPAPRPNLMYEYKGYKPPQNGWAISKQKMEQWDKEGRLHFPKNPNGRIQRKRFLDELKGKPVQNLWDDIKMISSQSDERLGYPTQKPIPLLKRIINASSNEGDVVFDPFCGCGTALIAANELKRRWIGIDITHLAIFLIEQRLKDSFGESIKDIYKVYGNPEDVESAQALWNKSTKEFELWALSLVGAIPRARDGGVDGVLGFVDEGRQTKKIVVQVKGGEHLAPTIIRDLIGTVNDEKAAMGLLITLHKPTFGMVQRAIHSEFYHSPLWNKSFPSIQIRTIHELLIEGKGFDLPPQVTMLKQAERLKEQGIIEPLL